MNKDIIVLSEALTVSMADEWFDIATADHFWMQWRFHVIKNELKKKADIKPGMKFLEIGCGHGQFLKQCQGVLSEAVDGCDLNVYALKKIEDAQGDIYVYNIHDRNAQMLEKYNGVFLLDVIEHIDDDSAFLRDALAHLKPGGLIVINVPALRFLFSKYDVVAGHKRRYSVKQIHTLLESCGLQPLYVGYWGFLLLPIAFVRKFMLMFIPKNKVIENGFSPQLSGINWLFKLLMKVELAIFSNPLLGTSVIGLAVKQSR